VGSSGSSLCPPGRSRWAVQEVVPVPQEYHGGQLRAGQAAGSQRHHEACRPSSSLEPRAPNTQDTRCFWRARPLTLCLVWRARPLTLCLVWRGAGHTHTQACLCVCTSVCVCIPVSQSHQGNISQGDRGTPVEHSGGVERHLTLHVQLLGPVSVLLQIRTVKPNLYLCRRHF